MNLYTVINKNKKNGFTLVELSIVLVIIGLIVGGVVGGQSLIQSAKVSSVVVDFKKYQTAINMFKDKYDAQPGDMVNATSYWSSTSNGNGNGFTEWSVEAANSWEQISLAGLVPGIYPGYTALPELPGRDMPESKIKGGGFGYYWQWNGWNGAAAVAAGYPAHHGFLFGADSRVDTNAGSILSPSDAYSIDAKMDDGKPSSGKVRGSTGYYSSGTNCTTGVTHELSSTTTYLFSNNKVACTLYYSTEK